MMAKRMRVFHLDIATRSIVHANHSPPFIVQACTRRLRWYGRNGRMPSTKRASVPTFNERLPDVILQSVRVRKLLDEMLYRVLAQSEEVRSRDRVRVRAVADVICGANDNGPSAGGCTRYDGFLGLVVGDDLEIWTGLPIQYLAVVHHFRMRITS